MNIMNNSLTVEQLIKKLQAYPKDFIILVDGYENDYDAVLDIENIKVKYDNKNPWWNGRFKENKLNGVDAVRLLSTRGVKI